MNNVIWHPIPGFKNYFINRDGDVKNHHGRIMKVTKKTNRSIILRKNNGEVYFNLTKAQRQIFVNNPEFATFTKTSFFNNASPKKRGNYSLDEVIFELEIKGKKVS